MNKIRFEVEHNEGGVDLPAIVGSGTASSSSMEPTES
jgi:hypothetical protein